VCESRGHGLLRVAVAVKSAVFEIFGWAKGRGNGCNGYFYAVICKRAKNIGKGRESSNDMLTTFI